MPLKDKYIPVVELMQRLNAEIIRAEEDRGWFVIEGRVETQEQKDLVEERARLLNDVNADDIKLNIQIRKK